MNNYLKNLPQFALVAALFVVCGCNGDKGTVTGTVTLDGAPVSNAFVQFFPDSGGRPADALTNAEGAYELRASRSEVAAPIGKYKVSISTANGASDSSDSDYGASMKETLPAKYNSQTELTAEVTSGSNVIDFALESGGQIIQPKAGY